LRSGLASADLHLYSVIPYLQLRPEQTKTGEATALPLHPFVVAELRKLSEGVPEAKLFAFLPEGRTMLADLTRAGVKQADASGRRADYHGLRHTFAKRLDETGCSHATRRALMRHSAGDQTDGYTLARLSEMYEAVKRLPAPREGKAEAEVRTGTDGIAVVDTTWTQAVPGSATPGIDRGSEESTASARIVGKNSTNLLNRQALTASGLSGAENGDTVQESSPRSSVG
jgi:hypothetical protein